MSNSTVSPTEIVLTIQLDLLQVTLLTSALAVVKGITCCETHQKVILDLLAEELKGNPDYHKNISNLRDVFIQIAAIGEQAKAQVEADLISPTSRNFH